MRQLLFPLALVGVGLSLTGLGSGCSSGTRGGFGAAPDAGHADPSFADSDATPACVKSPGNYDVPDNNCDDDDDGQVDNVPSCDDDLDIEGDAEDFAKALGICQKAEGDKWGLVSASFAASYGSTIPADDRQHGILRKFGKVLKPQQGGALGVLSSGWAREFNGPSGSGSFQDGEDMSGPGDAPKGFPKPASGCQIETATNDVIVVKLKIKTPKNAQGVGFDFNFFSGEWPQWVCTRYNDGFAAILTSKAFNDGAPDNISFDAQNNPVSVNNGFFDRCTPGTQTGCNGVPPKIKTSTCPGGESELQGTGFAEKDTYCGTKPSTGGGATGWLTSKAPVEAGETITLELVIWDTGDSNYDSSVLLDNITWEAGETTTVTERPR
jgi:hypothetical protein